MAEKKPKKPEPKRALSDHRRVGKRYIPPFLVHIPGGIRDVLWVDRLVPELLWMGLLVARQGVGRGSEVALATVRALRSVRATVLGLRASDFDGLSTEEFAAVQHELSQASNLQPLRLAIRPLVTLYPTFPLRGLFPDAGTADPEEKRRLTEAVGPLLNRRSREATIVQATAVYVAALCGSVKLMKIPGVDLNSVKDFPETEESRLTASFVRTTVSAFLPDRAVPAHPWPIEFWNRGYEIDSCVVAST